MTERSTGVLIDLDAFLAARAAKGHADASRELSVLLRTLRRQLGAQRRAVVLRAYADLGRAGDVGIGADELARFGLEVVHVGSTAVSDGVGALRLALDAVQLAAAPSALRDFVLVSGAPDLSPLLVDLRRHGASVQVIGVAGSTRLAQRACCDELHFFEDLASPNLLAEIEAERAQLRGAVVEILARRRPVPVAQLAELVGKSLGRPLENLASGADPFEDLLRENERDFGIVLRRGEHEVLVADLRGDGVPPPARSAGPEHSVAEYRQLLRLRNPRVHLTARDEWLAISELYFRLAGGDGPERQVVHQQELTERVLRECETAGMESPEKKAQSIVFQLFKCGAFVCAESGAEGETDFHWSRPARLSDAARDLETMRQMARVYIARVLIERMQSEYGTHEVDPEVFAEMLDGASPDDEQVGRVEDVLDAAEDALSIPVHGGD